MDNKEKKQSALVLDFDFEEDDYTEKKTYLDEVVKELEEFSEELMKTTELNELNKEQDEIPEMEKDNLVKTNYEPEDEMIK